MRNKKTWGAKRRADEFQNILFQVMMSNPALLSTVNKETPEYVLGKIPRSWFTKRGPGVQARARTAFRSMSPGQKKIAQDRGWLPRTWS